jgi:hypothetical protein
MRLCQLCLMSLLALAGCHERGGTDPVVLESGGHTLRRSDFERHLAQVEARSGVPLDPEVRRNLLEPFLEQHVLLLEARARGLVEAGGGAEAEQRGVARLLAEEVGSVEVAAGEVERHYLEHAEEFVTPEAVTLRQILVPTLNEARDVRRRLGRDPRSFDTLARTRSRSPEAAQGGLMGRFSRGQLPDELERPAFALPAGGTSEIVETGLGYHILRAESREAARALSLEEASPLIRARLAREKSERRARQFVRELLARAKVNHAAAITPSTPS